MPEGCRAGAGALEALRLVSGGTRRDLPDVRERLLEPSGPRSVCSQAVHQPALRPQYSGSKIDAGVAAKAEEVKTVEADFFPVFFPDRQLQYSFAPAQRQLNPSAWDQFNYRADRAAFGIRWPLNFPHHRRSEVSTPRAELASRGAAASGARGASRCSLSRPITRRWSRRSRRSSSSRTAARRGDPHPCR